VTVPTVDGKVSPLGVPLSLLASAIFLATGGPARVVMALARDDAATNVVARTAVDLAAGVELSVAIAGPILCASVVLEVGAALIARAATPAQLHALLAPLRTIGILAVVAIVLDRMAGVIAETMR
jgi:type III secretory pathway component EscT